MVGKTRNWIAKAAVLAVVGLTAASFGATQDNESSIADEESGSENNRPASVGEARVRAKLLHETIHGALQVMHRDFFDSSDRDKIPSASLEDVFETLATDWDVKIRWLGVDGVTMDVEHEPKDDFERAAFTALSAGKTEYEAVEDGRYRRAGVIVLHNVCLKCHVPNRTSLEDRAAGLTISMPIGSESPRNR